MDTKAKEIQKTQEEKEISKKIVKEKLDSTSIASPISSSVSLDEKSEISIQEKLMALYNLQQIDTKIDKIRIIRGELPLEVSDLEDEIAGLETRVQNLKEELHKISLSEIEKNNKIAEAKELIKKYEAQQNNVRNNREFEALNNEIEFQKLEILHAEKKLKEDKQKKAAIEENIKEIMKKIEEKKADLAIKKAELEDIIKETEKEEQELLRLSKLNEEKIEERLLIAYKRIRKNARNGLAVVPVERGACGGCFNKIPPQKHLEIKMRKKIIVCEYCGRILIDMPEQEQANKN